MKQHLSYFLPNETAMADWARTLARCISSPCQVHLIGELGTGKTTLVRAILRHLGYSGLVKSPTYTLIEPYETSKGLIYHMDLYRLADGEELEYLGIRDIDRQDSICFIEWPEKAQGYLPAADVLLNLAAADSGRRLGMRSVSDRGAAVVACTENSETEV